MKFRGIILLSFLFLLLSCSKDNNETNFSDSNRQFILKASFEPGPRTFINDEYGKIFWSEGDAISLFADEYEPVRMVTDVEGETAEFKCDEQTPDLSDASEYIGLYPYNSDAYLFEGCLFFELPYSQAAVPSSYDPDAFFSAGRSTSNEMGFYNLSGGLRFTVTGSNINRVVFSSNDDDNIISGDVCVDMYDENPSLLPRDGLSSVELISPQPLTPGVYYYISIIPQLLEEGFTMYFYNDLELVGQTVCQFPVEISVSAFSTVHNADDQAAVSRILTGFDLSVDGTCVANSYIVPSPGYYKIPLIKADGTAVDKVSMVSCLWESVNTAQRPDVGSCLKVIACRGGYAYFKVPDDGVPSHVRNSNAVLSAYSDRGEILWSWHIWIWNAFNPYDNSQILNGTDAVILDRNLGALSASPADQSSFGLLYQWGRPNAFPGAACDNVSARMATTTTFNAESSARYSGNMPFVIACPTTFITSSSDWMYTQDSGLWDGGKTVYDPCPYGWRIPSADDFKGCTYSPGSYSWFPLCGRLSGSYGLQDVGVSGSVWTCSTDGEKSVAVNFDKSSLDDSYAAPRAEGRPVRCVQDVEE